MFWTIDRVILILAVTAWASTMILLLYIVDMYQRGKQYRVDSLIDITQDLNKLNKIKRMADEQISGKRRVNRICPDCGGTNVFLRHNEYGYWFRCRDCLALSDGYAETISELATVWTTKPRTTVMRKTGEPDGK